MKYLNKAAFIVALVTLGGCYPNGAEYIEDLDLVYTNYDNTYDFGSKGTYALPDSVVKITGENFNDPDGDQKPDFIRSDYSDAILDQIEQNMSAFGWTRVDKNNSPDVILLTTTSTTTNLYYYYDWWYWYWWYPGWYPWYGWYYPGYYPIYVSGYRTGSVLIQMVDHQKATVSGTLAVVWTSVLNGLAEGGSGSITARIQSGITQAFTQSPYLRTN